jgi:hypothetical protein
MFLNRLGHHAIHFFQAGMFDFDGFKRLKPYACLWRHPGH